MSDTVQARPVAVIGAGAIGLALASAMARSGHSVSICGARQRIDEVRITESGVAKGWAVNHLGSPRDARTASTVIVAVKAHHTAAIGDWLCAFDHPNTTVIVAQNGVEQRERVTPYLSRAEIVPAVMYLNVERTAPGEATLRRVGDTDLAVGTDPASLAVAAALIGGGMRVVTESDLVTVAWAKLLTNITANPLTALTGRRAEVMRDVEIADLARALMAEAAMIGRAEGAALTDAHVDRALGWLQNVPEGSTTSMRQDRLAGRAMEHDALTGAILRAGDRHGIPAPTNRIIYALLNAVRDEVTP